MNLLEISKTDFLAFILLEHKVAHIYVNNEVCVREHSFYFTDLVAPT